MKFENILSLIIIFLLSFLILSVSGLFLYNYYDYTVSSVNGDSMEPNYKECDLLFYSSSENIEENQAVVFETEENKYIKRVYDIEENYNFETSNYIVENNVFIYKNNNILFEHKTKQDNSYNLKNKDVVITASDNRDKLHPYIIEKDNIKTVDFKVNKQFNIFC